MATNYATPVSVSVPMSLALRLDAEQERQGIKNRSQFLRTVLEAYIAKCDANAAQVKDAA